MNASYYTTQHQGAGVLQVLPHDSCFFGLHGAHRHHAAGHSPRGEFERRQSLLPGLGCSLFRDTRQKRDTLLGRTEEAQLVVEQRVCQRMFASRC
jgi:hypothetical protein